MPGSKQKNRRPMKPLSNLVFHYQYHHYLHIRLQSFLAIYWGCTCNDLTSYSSMEGHSPSVTTNTFISCFHWSSLGLLSDVTISPTFLNTPSFFSLFTCLNHCSLLCISRWKAYFLFCTFPDFIGKVKFRLNV